MLTPREAERWALAVLDRIERRQHREDGLVELKLEWPEPYKAARRIAAHVNSARGNDVLWIIGAKEDAGVAGAPPVDLAKWWPSVTAWFEAVAPGLTDVVVPFGEKAVHALCFDSSRAPILVSNPDFGKKGEVITAEIPWREGTAVRSARRQEVLQMLLPQELLPDVELLSATAKLIEDSRRKAGDPLQIEFSIEAYVMPRSDKSLILPLHAFQGSVSAPGYESEIQHVYYSAKSSRRKTSIIDTINAFRSPTRTNLTIKNDADEPLLVSEAELVISRALLLEISFFLHVGESDWANIPEFFGELRYKVGLDRTPLHIAFRAGKVAKRGAAPSK